MSTHLEDYGIVGDMETVALVSRDGEVDWFCWPRFDSPSVFGSLLDPDGGRWTMSPVGRSDEASRGRQLYFSETNVLLTRFHDGGGIVEVEDLMDVGPSRRLVRRIQCLRGSVEMTTTMTPRPDYGRAGARIARTRHGATIEWSDIELDFYASVPCEVGEDSISSTFSIEEGQRVVFSLGEPQDSPTDQSVTAAELDDVVEETIRFWQAWNERSTYRGRWRQAVERSALALKLLTHRSSGGVIAAATTSIPENIGGDRNWDYRYVWIRDAAFTIYSFLALGHVEEAHEFTRWLTNRLDDMADRDPPLAPLYDLDGNSDLDEIELDHWVGYEHSSPVRVGNGASDQLQLDIYGELIDSLYLTDKHGDGLSLDSWESIRRIVEWLIDNWERPDQGMWESRDNPERHTSSLLMCWVAVERAMRMATQRGRPADLERWREARDRMHEALCTKGWSDELQAFTRTLGGSTMDASILLAPLVKFIPGDDPRWLSTLEAIEESLVHGPLVERYDTEAVDDGVGGPEGSFTICSFWYVEALARAGRVEQAHRMFDRLLTYVGPLGLCSEEIAPTGRQLGNFPQAFTHLALISAAIHLDEALG